MKALISSVAHARFVLAILLAAALIPSLRSFRAAQGPAPNSVNEQREAMRKLLFLRGRWSGLASVVIGPGKTLHLTQTEHVQYKLDGLVLLIEGKGTAADGKVLFSALATVAYDEATHGYRFRAYNDGHYLDRELSVTANGFSWSFTAGQAHIVNTMDLTDKGEWHEVTQMTFGGGPPRPSMEMTLRRLP
jgi:hypothetical protein